MDRIVLVVACTISSMSNHDYPLHIKAWLVDDILLERYTYPPGPPGALAKHVHDEYQLCVSLNFDGEYAYRGASHAVPAGSLSVLHPGEPHAARDVEERVQPAAFRLMYLEPEWFHTAFADNVRSARHLPFFGQPVILDPPLVGLFTTLHQALETGTSQLEHQSLLLLALTQLVQRHAQDGYTAPSLPLARPEVQRARDFLQEQYAHDVSLDQLARVVGLSPFHLCRSFRKQIGLSPHVYQTQVRVMRAKARLAQGHALSVVAAESGFYDQSHFGWHFKRLVGVTPGQYGAQHSKNFLDPAS